MLECEENTIRLVYLLIVDSVGEGVVELTEVKETLTEGLDALCGLIFKVELALFFEVLYCLS